MRTKRCSVCGDRLPIKAFHRRRHHVRSGLRAACEACTSKATKRAKVEGRRKKADPLKEHVRYLTRMAIERGELIPGPCAKCGDRDVVPHHRRYESEGAFLEVEWLCRSCHATTHGKQAWTRQLELRLGQIKTRI